MKKIYQRVILLMIGLLTGCTKITPTPFPQFTESVREQSDSEVQGQEVVEMGLKLFFKTYFSLSEEEVLLLNQNPSKVDSAYWETYKAYKENLLKLIGDYLTPAASAKIKEQYLTYDFHLPKKLQLNEYVTLGPAIVEAVHIVDSRPTGENTTYRVAVTTHTQVDTLNEANKKYEWDAEKNYYVKAEDQIRNKYTFSVNQLSEATAEHVYLYAEISGDVADEIKLIQYYWVEISPGTKLQIESVKEATAILVSEQTRQLAHNTKHIERVPYSKEVSAREQNTIKIVMNKLMTQSDDFYSYYEKAFHTGYDVFKLIWEKDLELVKEVVISEASYKEAFHSVINPYKHTVKKLEPNDAKITIRPSVYGTKKQPRFIVDVPVKAILTNNETVYYNYKYYIGMEQNKIEFIQFMHREALAEEVYLNESSDSEPTQEAQDKAGEK
ncbi:hypothetical protein [Cellulosilyticum sp. I15G10I2]|uniref:hypothetical protein n=1 Tax=Cellulosilyticum sp. I15G10I2 TaxID=1892843 RepID=UPI00085C1D13|nr:hypothetical protein [Cellulosilyticum sp. I15G10I2]